MKILRILTRPNVGGPTRQVASLWQEQTRAGHDCVTVVGRCQSDEAGFDLTALGVPSIGPDQVRVGRGFCTLDHLGKAIAPADDRRALRQLRAVIDRFEPDVVHTHTSKAGWLGRWAARSAGVPVVAHTFHGHVLSDYFSSPLQWAVRQVERRLARRTDLVFAVSASCVAELAELGITARPIAPAVAIDRSRLVGRDEARARIGVRGDRLVLGFVGRFAPIKRVDRFVAVARAMPDALCVTFGEGSALDRIEAPDNLLTCGTQRDLGAWLPGLDVLVMPSEREGFPLAAVEAAACGVPTIGFDVPGVRDVVAAGAGRCVDPASGVDGLVAAIAAVRAAPPSGEALANLVAHCDPERVAQELLLAYDRALS